MDAPALDVPGVAAALWTRGEPEFIAVGVDNGASTRESTNPLVDRASEFLPYPDPSWTEPPYPQWRGDLYPSFLLDEVKAQVDGRFRTLSDRASTTLAGSSYSAIAALNAALDRPGVVGKLLLQSPSAHVGAGRFLADVAALSSPLDKVYVDVGDLEGETPAIQSQMVRDVTELQRALAARAVRNRFVLAPGADHSFEAWRARLPAALNFMFQR